MKGYSYTNHYVEDIERRWCAQLSKKEEQIGEYRQAVWCKRDKCIAKSQTSAMGHYTRAYTRLKGVDFSEEHNPDDGMRQLVGEGTHPLEILIKNPHYAQHYIPRHTDSHIPIYNIVVHCPLCCRDKLCDREGNK